MTIYIDMDDVLVDWSVAAEELFGEMLFETEIENYGGYPYDPGMMMRARNEVGSRDNLSTMLRTQRHMLDSPLRVLTNTVLSHPSMEDWWASLPCTPFGTLIMDECWKIGAAVSILTKPISYDERKNAGCKRGKLRWVRRFIDMGTPVLFAHDKSIYAFDKHDILIDDSQSNIDAWWKAGGTGILIDNENYPVTTEWLIDQIQRR